MNKNYSIGEQVIYKKRLLGYPAVVISESENEVEIALSPNGNKSDHNNYMNWERVV
jgi:hypothetical protein